MAAPRPEAMEQTMEETLEELDEPSWARAFVTRVVAACPRRVAGSDDERRAHAIIRSEMDALDLTTEQHDFEWNESLYANLALHFGLGTLGSLVARRRPLVGFALHALAASSYTMDSTRKAFWLRRLFPRRSSQNVLGTMPARSGKPRLRLVFLAHADAAFTGVVFRPWFVKTFAGKHGSFTYKGLRVATRALGGLALVDLAQLYFGKSRKLSLARALLTVPPLVTFAFNADVVLRDQVVPGAADDLSGVAGMLLLVRRLRGRVPDDVEVVFVATGCEESGLGGAQALSRDMGERWERRNTVVLGLDGLANGELRFFLEGEIETVPLAPWLRGTIERVASDVRFSEVQPFDIPVGGTDAVPFATAGWDAVTFGCVDPTRGTPRHYHLATDTPENLEAEKIPFCLDFVERVVQAIVTTR